MSTVNQPTYYVERKGWFSSTLEPVTKKAFRAHQNEKFTTSSFLNKATQTVALGVLALTQSARFAMRSSFSGTQAALSLLGVHVWSQIPTAHAQTTTLAPPTLPPGPQGEEFQINTNINGTQDEPSAVSLEGGGVVVTWASTQIVGAVYGQRLDGMGAKIGSEFLVSTNRANRYSQESPSVASLEGGGFVVTWEAGGPDGDSGIYSYGIYGQIYDGAGAKVGSELHVNTYTMNDQKLPNVASLKGGGFIVTWQSNGQDGSGEGIYGQMYDGTGAKVGIEFQVNTYTMNDQIIPNVVSLEGGGFIVTWHSDGQDAPGVGIYGQLYDGIGMKVGSEFQINTDTVGPGVPVLQGGGFVVPWDAYEDGSWGIFGQLFDGMGGKVGSEFRINTDTTRNNFYPHAVSLTGGGYVVTWESTSHDNLHTEVYGQRFDEMGTKLGNEFQVNVFPGTGAETRPYAASLKGGGFVISWQSYGQDGSGSGIYGRIFPANFMTGTLRTTALPGSISRGTASTSMSPIDMQTTISQLSRGSTSASSFNTLKATSLLNSTNSQSSMSGGSIFTLPAGISIPLAAGIGGGVVALLISIAVGSCVCVRSRSRRGAGHLEQGSSQPHFTISSRSSARMGSVDRASYKSARYSGRIDEDEAADINEALRVIMTRRA